jgi:ATP-dependent exoDNAse (exonuclease V) alpha subunit
VGKHLSIRLPWHDRGWDGHVCDHPTANVFCIGEFGLKAHGIRDKKDAEAEEQIRGKPCSALKAEGYLPPCLRTIQTFGGTKALNFIHEPKDFLSTSGYRIESVPESVPAFTAGTWPYDRVFRMEGADEEVPEEFEDRYSPKEMKENIEDFFSGLVPGRSLVFFYLNYDNPLNSEKRRYVLIGAAEFDLISSQLEWERMDPARSQRYGTFVWNRFISHHYGQGRGARLPYERYLQKGIDPGAILVEVPEELTHHFKYVCRAFTDDEAGILLGELLAGLEAGKASGAVEWDWDKQIAWVNTALDGVWKNRGLFPGAGPVLEALGFPNATLYVRRYLVDRGVSDVRGHIQKLLKNPKLAEDKAAQKGFEQANKTLRILPQPVNELLFDRLILMELSTAEVKRITGSGLVSEKERQACGLRFDAAQALANPYLIVEQFDPFDNDPVPFHRVDNGIFLPKSRGGATVPGIDEFTPDDARRIRAAAFLRLRRAGNEGHTFLPQDDLLDHLSRLRLPGLNQSGGAVSLAKELEFLEEILSFKKEGSLVAWMLRSVDEDEELIRGRIQKLRARKDLSVKVAKPGQYLPSTDLLPKEVRAEARNERLAVLENLSKRTFTILTGGAGTGKTTIIAAFIGAIREAQAGEQFLLLAPTGKAAVRLKRTIRDVTGTDMEPRTIHSYLVRSGWMDGETWRMHREGAPANDDATTVIIDECSMLDTTSLATVFRALDWTKVRRLILCGDSRQLPPIGLGAPFRNIVDALSASADPPRTLRVNCRQLQEGSSALKLAQCFTGAASRELEDEVLNELRTTAATGKAVAATGNELDWVRVGVDLRVAFFRDEHDLPRLLDELAKSAMAELLKLEKLKTEVDGERVFEAYDRLHRYDAGVEDWRLDAFEVLSPYRGNYFGSDELNRRLQGLLRAKLLNFKYAKVLGKPSGRRYVAPDKVLQTQNYRIRERERLAWDGRQNVEHFVANGELGRLMSIGKRGAQRVAWVRFETSPQVVVTVDQQWGELNMDLGYAMTVHKAQGSDFGGVVVIVPREESQKLVSRELLYTAFTRFRRRLYLLLQGDKGDLQSLLQGLWAGSSDYLRRNTSLYGMRLAIKDLEDFRPEQRIHTTLREELVRSKSEVVIANQLFQHKLPYYYEKPLVGRDGSIRRPDFTIPIETSDGPDIRYWEHWGMLGDPNYEASVKRRKAWYEKNGFRDKLVESDERGGFDSKKIEKMIRDHLLP